MSELSIPGRDTARNIWHAANPSPGDAWEEMCCWYCVVLAVSDNTVMLCRKRRRIDKDHFTWDLDSVEAMPLKEFTKLMSYGSIPGCWADVHPGAMMWAVKEIWA